MPAPTTSTDQDPVRQVRPAKNSLPDPATDSTPTSSEETTHASHPNRGHRADQAGDTAMTSAKSAYPIPVAELLPKAQELADRLGEVPSRNRLKAELRIGAPKANAILEQLSRDQVPDISSGRLRVVRDTEGDEPEPSSPSDSASPELEASPVVEPATDPVESTSSTQVDDEAEQTSEPADRAPDQQDTASSDPVAASATRSVSSPRAWPVLILALPAFVAIWSGWVGLGGLTGFGIVHPLPGIADEFALNTAITLPIGMETYAAYALRVWVSRHVPRRARRFARASALGSLALGALGQIVYHLMAAAHITSAPWPITTAVACLPVAVLGMGAALTHLLHTPDDDQEAQA